MNAHLQPWTVSAEGFPADGFASDRLEYLLQYAILAPSPHNTQPWLFRINASDVEVHADPRRRLRCADPQGRQMSIACGAALFNLRVAAEYFGQSYRVELCPEPGEPMLLARLTIHAGGETSSEDIILFHAIVERHTNREAFQPQPVPEAVFGELMEAASVEGASLTQVDEGARVQVSQWIAEADRRQWADRAFRKELAQWVRTDAEHQADGIPTRELGVQDWLAFAGPAIVRTFNRGNDQAARDADIALRSPTLAVLATDGDDPGEWLRAGQALERVLLVAQSEGVAVSYLNQPLELEDLRGGVASVCGGKTFPQILLRLGEGPSVPPTPRRDVHGLLLRQDPGKVPPH